MKLFLLASALILTLGCYRKQKAPERKRHYWFVGYQAYKSKDYFRTGGFIQWGDSIISLDKTKQLIRQHINCSGASFETGEIVILSFCELPDSVSAFKLLGSDTAAWSYCEEPQEKPILYKKLVVAGDMDISDSDLGPIITPANRPLKITVDSSIYGNPYPSPIPDTLRPRDSCGLHWGYNVYIVDDTPKLLRYYRPVMMGMDTSRPIRFEKRKDGGNIGRTMRNGVWDSSGKPHPSLLPDTLKPGDPVKVPWSSKYVTYNQMKLIKISKFIYLYSPADGKDVIMKQPEGDIDSCFEFYSKFGHKPCRGQWVIIDTIKLLNVLFYSAVEMSPYLIDKIISVSNTDTGEIWYGNPQVLFKSLNRLEKDSVVEIKVPQSKDGNYYWGDTSGLRPRPNPIPSDTTIKPRYEYYYKFQNQINKVDAAYDTIRRFILPVIGNRMFKDEADYYQTWLMSQINNIIGRPTVDSIKVELTKK